MRKTWVQKLADKKNMPKVLRLEKGFPCYNAMHKMGADAGDKVILVNPSEIVPIMAKVSKGKIITVIEICKAIAKKYKVKGCCSLTTGIFIMTAANAAQEVIDNHEKSVLTKLPYWRTLKSDGFLNDKYPGGALNQKKLLEKEGIKVISRGKKYQVENWGKYLFKI